MRRAALGKPALPALAAVGMGAYNLPGSPTFPVCAMNVLFVTSNRIGDAVLSTGLVNYIIETHPNARITLACGPLAAPLFEATPNVVRIISLAKRKRAGHWFELWHKCVGRFWDLVVDLRASALAWLLIAKKRRVLKKSDGPVHRLRLLADVLKLDEVAAPRIWTGESHRVKAAALVPMGGPVLAVGPTANWGGKQWPGASYAELIGHLTAAGGVLEDARIAVLGGADERPAAAPVIAAILDERCIDLVGKVDLLTAHAVLERCQLYVGNDSGLMHLSAAARIPTLGLFGPSNEVHYGPWGEHTAVVRTPETFEEILHTPGYDYRSQRSLMGSLSVEEVAKAAESLLRRASVGAA